MGQFNLSMQGRNVRLALISTFSNGTSIPLGIFDDQNNPVALLPTERLVVDYIQGQCNTGPVYLIGAAIGTISKQPSTLIAVFPNNGTNLSFNLNTKEGYAIPVGLSAIAAVDHANSTVKLAGTGRIVDGRTQGIRPSWKELQTANGNF